MSPNRRDEPSVERTTRRSARLKDVAVMAGVDVSIASRVLNNDPKVFVRPETRKRIQEAARTLKYRPNALGRGLRRHQTMTLGLVVPDVTSPVYFEIIRGAEEQAFEERYVLLLANAHEFAKAGEAYRRLLLEGRVDGVLMASATNREEIPPELETGLLPYVWVNRRAEGASGPSVLEDDEAGMALGVEHLASLGHRVIAHIAGPQEVDTGRRRLEGFRSAMSRLGLTPRPEHTVEDLFTEEGGFRAMQSLLATSPRPTAVAISSVAAAIGALSAVKRAGLQVPGDLSLVAFHDASLASYLEPPLTTILMPLRELGQLAVRSLLRLISGEQLPAVTMVTTPPRLIARASTAPPRSAE